MVATGQGATTELLANRFRVDPAAMAERLMQLEMRGMLLSVARWADEPGMGDLQWVPLGDAAMHFSRERYDELEQRAQALAAWKGYELVAHDPDTPPRRRRYTIEVRSTAEARAKPILANRLDKALWRLRYLPPVSELE